MLLVIAVEVIFVVVVMIYFPAVDGCGVIPAGQGRTLNYEVRFFKLPAAMAYSEDRSDPSRAPSISTSEQQAVTFAQNVIMRSIEDVLYQQGRGAGLTYDVISSILNQLDVTVNYRPLKCVKVFNDQMGVGVVVPMMLNCQIIDNTVMKTCMPPPPAGGGGNVGAQAMPMCMPGMLNDIEPMHLIISGTITTTNIIMANWSTQMWQSILNRALQSITSGPLRSQFTGATVALR